METQEAQIREFEKILGSLCPLTRLQHSKADLLPARNCNLTESSLEMSNNPLCRVLSLQSHVVSGYVGNRSASFPLQVLGFEVDAVNSVQLSNHTGYKHFKGQVLNADELRELFDGLKLNDIHHYSHLLTGYVGSKSFLEEVSKVVDQLRDVNPKLIFVCDPVMGDNGKFYVPEDLLPVYRDLLVPKADIVTPNQFETELLTGIKILTEQDAFKAMKVLHDRGTKTVVITSSELKKNTLVALGSSYRDGNHVCIRMEIPKLDVIFTGTGDLFACLLLAWAYKHPCDLKLACEKTMSTVQTILKRTVEYATERAKVDGNSDGKFTPAQVELKLVQSLDDIREAKIIYKAEEVQHG